MAMAMAKCTNTTGRTDAGALSAPLRHPRDSRSGIKRGPWCMCLRLRAKVAGRCCMSAWPGRIVRRVDLRVRNRVRLGQMSSNYQSGTRGSCHAPAKCDGWSKRRPQARIQCQPANGMPGRVDGLRKTRRSPTGGRAASVGSSRQ
jgi:hypothetical protein